MPVLDFPQNPALDDLYTENGITYRWNSYAWVQEGGGGGPYVLVAGDTMTGALTVEMATGPYIVLDKNTAANVPANLIGSRNGLSRWSLSLGDSTAEAGANAGSDFTISRHDDAGTVLTAPLTIARSDGRSFFTNQVSVECNVAGVALTGFNDSGLQGAGGVFGSVYESTPASRQWAALGYVDNASAQWGVFTNGYIANPGAPNSSISTAIGLDPGGFLAVMVASSRTVKRDEEEMWDEVGDLVLQMKPVFHRYKEGYVHSYPERSFYSLMAEDVAALDPRFATWAKGRVYDENMKPVINGDMPQLTEEETPQDLNLRGIVSALINLVQRMEARIAELEQAS